MNTTPGNSLVSDGAGDTIDNIRDALALVDLRVLDHLVVAGSTVTSFVERGLL